MKLNDLNKIKYQKKWKFVNLFTLIYVLNLLTDRYIQLHFFVIHFVLYSIIYVEYYTIKKYFVFYNNYIILYYTFYYIIFNIVHS